MKRLTFILCIAACGFVSCIKENPVQETPVQDNANGTTVTANMTAELTKTVLGEKDGTSWPVLWQTGDQIDINGSTSAPLAEGGDATAVFSFEDQLEAPYKAVYPASAITGSGEGELPAVQEYTEGSFDAAAGILLGTGDQEGVYFHQAMAYIAFVPKGEGTKISSLKLTATGGEKLSGAFTTDYATLTMSDEASSSVSVNCASAVELGKEIIVAVPAQTYSQGFTVLLTDEASGYMQKSTGKSWTAEAGHIYTTELSYVPTIDVPEALYIAGDAVEWSWSLEDERARIDGTDGVFTKELRLNFGENGNLGFKLFSNTSWGGEFGMLPESVKDNVGFTFKGYISGVADPQFYLGTLGYESGDYTLTIDFNTMTLSLALKEVVQPVVEPFYVFGGGLDCDDWTFDEAYALNHIGDNVYEGHDIHLYKTSYFKFDKQDWTEYRRDASAADYWTLIKNAEGVADNSFVPGEDPGFKNGKYTVRIDLNTLKVTLTLTEEDPEDVVTYIYLYGAAFADYTDWNDWIPVPSVGNDIYETTLNLNVGDEQYARGFKIYKAKDDWSNEYCMFSDSTADNIKFGHKNETGDNQVIPFNLGYTESGNYVVRIDFNTMTIKFTKQ